MSQQKLAAMLEGADRRSIGRANEVARLVLKESRRFRELINCLWNKNPVVRLRAADAAEKVSAKKPRLLDRHKRELLGLLAEAEQIELRWHLAAMVPRLRLTPAERQRAAATLRRYLEDRSSIVKTFALHALADLAQKDIDLRPPGKTSPRRSPSIRHTRHARPRSQPVEKVSCLAKYFPRICIQVTQRPHARGAAGSVYRFH